MIPENPPVSSMMATLLTFSNLLLTTQAPPTYANPKIHRNIFISREYTQQHLANELLNSQELFILLMQFKSSLDI